MAQVKLKRSKIRGQAFRTTGELIIKGPRFYVYPYKQGSNSAKELAKALGGHVLKVEGSKFKEAPFRKVINWGASGCPWSGLNKDRVSDWANKLTAFNQWHDTENGPRLPPFTTSPTEAAGWLAEGHKVVCRGTLTGHSGAGITIVEPIQGATLPNVPLYVQYIPKDEEYRVHVFKTNTGEPRVIDVQRKVRDPSREPSNWQVRSHDNGFIFIRTAEGGKPYKDTCPKDVLEQATKALASSGLTFGACDIVFNKKRKSAYVLEVNCAPGLEGSTIEIYANAIKEYFGVETKSI